MGYPALPAVPTVIITNPVYNAVFTTGGTAYSNVTVTATVTSSNGIAAVDFYWDDIQTPLYQVGSSSFYTNSFQIGPGTNQVGVHTISAIAQDNMQLTGTSQKVPIDVINGTNTVIIVNNYNTIIPANSPSVVLLVLTNATPSSGLKISAVNFALGSDGNFASRGNVGTVTISYDQTYLIYTPFANTFGTDSFLLRNQLFRRFRYGSCNRECFVSTSNSHHIAVVWGESFHSVIAPCRDWYKLRLRCGERDHQHFTCNNFCQHNPIHEPGAA